MGLVLDLEHKALSLKLELTFGKRSKGADRTLVDCDASDTMKDESRLHVKRFRNH